jgi:hypothetical protein
MDELAKRLQELAEKIAPSVLDAARAAVRVEAISTMMSKVECLGVSIALGFAARYLWRYKPRDEFDNDFASLSAWVIGLAALILCALSVWTFIDPWTWVALNNPDLWLAKKILNL